MPFAIAAILAAFPPHRHHPTGVNVPVIIRIG
jgi:hypothetical protein